MTNDWKTGVLKLRYWKNEEDALEYVELVEMAKYQSDLDTCRCLMKTFVTEEDYGVQESVNSVLSTAKPEDRQRALLEELPRLIIDTPEWADVLVETEIRFHSEVFKTTVKKASPNSKKALDKILRQDSFLKQFPGLSL